MLKEKIAEDLKAALKGRDQARVSVLRMLLSALHNKEIETRAALTDEQVLSVLVYEQKKHRDSIEQFKTGGRPDLAGKEEAELGVIESYLPEVMGEDELQVIVREVIAKIGAKGKEDFGKVMKEVMVKVRGRADGSAVSEIVSEKLPK